MDRRVMTPAFALILAVATSASPSWARMGAMMGMWGAAAAPTTSYIFSSDMESSTGWTLSGTTTPTFGNTSPPFEVNGYLKLTDTGTDAKAISPSFTAQSHVYGYFVWQASDTNTTTKAAIIELRSSDVVQASLHVTTNTLAITHGTKSGTNYAASPATKYYIWYEYVASTATNGIFNVWVSTTCTKPESITMALISDTGTSTGSIDQISFSGRNYTSGSYYYVDTPIVDDSTIESCP